MVSAEGAPAVIGGAIDEAERDHPAPHRLTEAGQRKAGAFQRLDDSNPANVALGKQARPVRLEDARLDQPGDVGRLDAGPVLRFVLARLSPPPGSVTRPSTLEMEDRVSLRVMPAAPRVVRPALR